LWTKQVIPQIFNQFLNVHCGLIRGHVKDGALAFDPWAVDRVNATQHLHKVMVHNPWAVNRMDAANDFNKVFIGCRRIGYGWYALNVGRYRAKSPSVLRDRLVWQMAYPQIA
jgi:hypothetical protein